ncbi:MAG: AtpZ/AtpI family protein [Phycisphaerae bacterium]|nr:AtpZ/AtpI family protein [Phycisphaerae bacterium]
MAVSRKKRFADNSYYRGAFTWMGVGIEFCLVVGVFALIGYFLDKWEGTSPGWMVIGFFVGFGVMLYTIIRRARKTQDEMDADDEKAGRDDEV